jgi:hypothetical protein
MNTAECQIAYLRKEIQRIDTLIATGCVEPETAEDMDKLEWYAANGTVLCKYVLLDPTLLISHKKLFEDGHQVALNQQQYESNTKGNTNGPLIPRNRSRPSGQK